MVLIERGGNANDDGVHFLDVRIVGGGGKAMGLGRLNFFRADAVDIRLALRQSLDFALVDIETGHNELLLAEQKRKRKSDVAEADDSDPRLALFNGRLKLSGRAFCGRVVRHRGGRNIIFWEQLRFDSSTRSHEGMKPKGLASRVERITARSGNICAAGAVV